MQVTGQATIFKNEKGIYKLSVTNKEMQEDGTEKNVFMNINVGFKKGVEVKNRTKINITNGFLTFFQIPTNETYENGNTIYRKFPKIMIMEFEVLEEGIDEPYHQKEYTANTREQTEFYPSEYSNDDLPF